MPWTAFDILLSFLYVDLSETRHQVREFSALKSQKLKRTRGSLQFPRSNQLELRMAFKRSVHLPERQSSHTAISLFPNCVSTKPTKTIPLLFYIPCCQLSVVSTQYPVRQRTHLPAISRAPGDSQHELD